MQHINRLAVAALVVLALSACAKEEELTPEQKVCSVDLFPKYDWKQLDQCVQVCKVCKKGNTVTCTTACKQRGAS